MEHQDGVTRLSDWHESQEEQQRDFRNNGLLRGRSFSAPNGGIRPADPAVPEATIANAPEATGATSAHVPVAVADDVGAAAEATEAVVVEKTLPFCGDGAALPPTVQEATPEERSTRVDEAPEVEAPHEVADDSPLLLHPKPKSKSRRRAVVWSAAFLAMLLAVLTVSCRRILRSPEPRPRGPPLTSSLKEVQAYEKALTNAASELKRLWGRVSPEVRQSFYTHYTPRVYGSPSLTSPLELFERQVMRVFQKGRPPQGASKQQYGLYVQQLQIARVVLKAAWTRLSQLQALEEFVVSRKGIEEDRYFLQPTVLPGAGRSSPGEELLSFRDFLDLLGAKKAAVPAYPDAAARKPAVPLALAQGLARTLQTLEFQTEMDATVHRAFHELLLVTGTPLPCGPLQPLEEFVKQGPLFVEPQLPFFPTPFFSSLLAAFSRERSALLVSDELLSTWAYQWTYEGASQRLEEIGERMRSSAASAAAVKLALVSRWALLQPHDPAASTDLACLAFSLL
ncbi:hypothetical protein, conserved [Eimeria maxima]|uniref:Transmembrane protein n=1 Tax=Eimeria maxima TaxID=5804 RepID=U6MDC7_EIMMA|nr:hypothetical protein, conserved [Eimeria maxima]CDJ60484.1 hypothetical protein, conserved [Eimeria maxima]